MISIYLDYLDDLDYLVLSQQNKNIKISNW